MDMWEALRAMDLHIRSSVQGSMGSNPGSQGPGRGETESQGPDPSTWGPRAQILVCGVKQGQHRASGLIQAQGTGQRWQEPKFQHVEVAQGPRAQIMAHRVGRDGVQLQDPMQTHGDNVGPNPGMWGQLHPMDQNNNIHIRKN